MIEEKEKSVFVPLLERINERIRLAKKYNTKSKYHYKVKSDVVECLQEVKDWIDNYRKSNELWRKSQDENLDDFEDELKSVFGDVKNEIRKRRR